MDVVVGRVAFLNPASICKMRSLKVSYQWWEQLPTLRALIPTRTVGACSHRQHMIVPMSSVLNLPVEPSTAFDWPVP